MNALLLAIPIIIIAALIIFAMSSGSSASLIGKTAAIGVSLIIVSMCLVPAIENADLDDGFPVVRPSENVLDVYLILGQSNAAYGVYDADMAAPVPKVGTSYYFGNNDNPAYFLGSTIQSGAYSFAGMTMHDMCDPSGDAKIGNIETPFAGEYTRYSGHDVYVINGGVPGTSISSWQSGQYCYTYAQDIFETAMTSVDLSAYDSVKLCSILWIQGENDAYMVASTYVELFLSMWESLQTWEYDSQHFEQIVISQTRYDSAPNSSIAQTQLGEGDYPGVYLGCTLANSFTVASGDLVADGLHYSQKGDNAIGVQLAKYCLKLRF